MSNPEPQNHPNSNNGSVEPISNGTSKSNATLRPTDAKSALAGKEEAVLAFWKEQQIFEKTLLKESPKGEFVFYEGPPTANAKPALHHLEARAFKDVLPRYKTMQGYIVQRRAGWDTHGLPVELQIEKKLGLTSKKDIERYGIAVFNAECKESVFTYIKDWEVFTDRIGYWVDKKRAYYTFDAGYMESLWGIIGEVDKKGLLYKDYKVLPWCPRCGTALSTHELAQGYQDDKDLSVTAKFKVIGEVNTFILAWTTTPWTLPGNVALAVGSDIPYIKAKVGEEYLIIANEKVALLPEGYEVIKTIQGSVLVGLQYEPLYPYLSDLGKNIDLEGLKNAYKVYAADFVTTTDGTGVVHTAVMYGQEDFELGSNVGLPKFHTVDDTGHFIKGTDFLEGRFVKDEETAIAIIKDLAHRGLLFKKEKYEHSYPHCWRCKTALIYYARDSWYIGMSTLRDELVKENDSINWEPSHIKEGRFGEWLREIKDWAISRERYWGTPLPIWISAEGDRLVIDSIAMLKQYTKKSDNTYLVMRHGQTEHNVKGLWNYGNQDGDPLTEEGKKQVLKTTEILRDTKIDMIIASPFLRTLETAQLIAQTLGLPEAIIQTDPRLGEWNVGTEYDGKPLDQFFKVRNASEDRYHFKAENAESYAEVFTRTNDLIYFLDKTYIGKSILIISHGAVTRSLELAAAGSRFDTMFEQTRSYTNFDNAELRTISFVPLPHNEHYELDLHRPYIDEVVLQKNGKEYNRIKEVMDVWFDSGAMPFAQNHYPFDQSLDGKKLAYPADFISEAIDQTRGWFYTLHAIGILMGKGKAYKNVICLGHLLDAEGKKMSKSIGNIVEPFSQIEKYGVDAVRFWMYSVNQPGDSKNYDEKTVDEIVKKVFNLTYNVLSFYELYRDRSLEINNEVTASSNTLDQWILARLDQLIALCTEKLDTYKVFEPTRAIRDFIDDMSTWYLRRSRDRIKDADVSAKQTLYRVLKTLAQLFAPFAPFTAEDIWQKLKTDNDSESVHLSEWPKSEDVQHSVLHNMMTVREICTVGNALRKKKGIPVRQPLSELKVESEKWKVEDEYIEIIKEELNIKAITFTEEKGISLSTTLTPELKAEGSYRELVRAVQDMRKGQDLTPSEMISLTISPDSETFLAPFLEDLKKTVQAREVIFLENDGQKIKIDNMVLKIIFEK